MMARLHTVPPRLGSAPARVSPAPTLSGKRITGRALQARRLRIWSENPYCVDCGALTGYPGGFELDHIVALVNGGQDVDSNCAVRCLACHAVKTAMDMQQAGQRAGMPAQ